MKNQKQAKRPTQTVRQENESLVRNHQIELKFSFPIPTAQAVGLVGLLQYVTDKTEIEHLLESGELRKPPQIDGEFAWSLPHILNLADLLERSRQWHPDSVRHRKKMSDSEKTAAEADIAERERYCAVWMQASTDQMIAEMATETDQRRRNLLSGMIITRLNGRIV